MTFSSSIAVLEKKGDSLSSKVGSQVSSSAGAVSGFSSDPAAAPSACSALGSEDASSDCLSFEAASSVGFGGSSGSAIDLSRTTWPWRSTSKTKKSVNLHSFYINNQPT